MAGHPVIDLARHADDVGDMACRNGLVNQIIGIDPRSEEHTSELQSQSTISYAVFCLKKKKKKKITEKKKIPTQRQNKK